MSLSIGNKEVKGLYVGNKKVVKIYNGNDNDPFYKEAPTGFIASVVGLGNSDPLSVTITKDTGFPTTFEEVTLNGNIFIKFPTFYRKVVTITDNQITAFNIATAKLDNSYEPYSVFVAPNGDVLPYVLIGKYISNSSSAMNSVSSGNANLTIGDARTYARALGSGYQQYDWQFQKLFQDLALVISGIVNFNSGTTITNYLGIYDLNKSILVDGLAKDGTTWVCATNPANYVDNATSSSTGYRAVSYSAPSTSNEIQKLGYDSNSPFFNFPNAVVSNSSYNTYYCDVYYYASGNRLVISFVGDAFGSRGLWYCSLNLVWSNVGNARLCYRPI